MTALADSSGIGFAVLDDAFRYQMINPRLACINGLPRSAHLGASTSEIFGDISRQIAEPHYQRLLTHGESSHFEVANQVLPTRPDGGYWGLNFNFPIRSGDGRIKQLGIFVVETTEPRKLQRVLRDLSGRISGDDEKSFWYAHKVQDCLDKYHEVLRASFETLFQTQVDSMEQLTYSVEALDARLAAMSQLISEVSLSFPADITDRQK